MTTSDGKVRTEQAKNTEQAENGAARDGGAEKTQKNGDAPTNPYAVRDAFTHWGDPIKVVYDPSDLPPEEEIGQPGQYPFVRGIRETMYRGRYWTMRQYAGHGSPDETNERFRALLKNGQTGLSVALDLPTQLGLDSDNPEARHDVGAVGVSISSLRDMENVFRDIPLDSVTTNFTINSTAPILLCMYAAVADEQGVPWAKVGGTFQNDILKEYIARGTYIFPIEPSLRLAIDLIEWSSRNMSRIHQVNVSSTHIHEAGANIVQEIAFALLDAIMYVERTLARGIPIDDFAPRISFNFASRMQFFQEIAKIRAARRLWAKLVKERWGSDSPNSQMARIFGGLSGSPMVAQDPVNNILRMAIGAVYSALAGYQAVHITPWDEPFAIPTEESITLALRAQQMVAYETDIAQTVDPLGGSYFVEALTTNIEERVNEIIDEVESEYGDMVGAIEAGFVQRAIVESSYADFKAIESGEQVIVGVNQFRNENSPEHEIELHVADPTLVERRRKDLADLRSSRDEPTVRSALGALEQACRSDQNTMPFILAAVKAYATTGEITDTMAGVFGRYREGVAVI